MRRRSPRRSVCPPRGTAPRLLVAGTSSGRESMRVRSSDPPVARALSDRRFRTRLDRQSQLRGHRCADPSVCGARGTPTLTWWSISGGVGARLGVWQSVMTVDVLGELVAERMSASASDPTSGRDDHGAQGRFGGRLGANVAARLGPGFRLLTGVDATALTPPSTSR